MKAFITSLFLSAGLLVLLSCEGAGTSVRVKDPITISSPEPAEQLTKVTLTDSQKSYVRAGNAMSFRLLKQLYGGKDMV